MPTKITATPAISIASAAPRVSTPNTLVYSGDNDARVNDAPAQYNTGPQYFMKEVEFRHDMRHKGALLNPLVWIDVTCTATELDADTGTGKVEVVPATTASQYKIRDIVLVGGGTNFGAGGDRLLDLTDGTTVYTTIANADIESAPSASLRWGDAKVPMLTGTSDTLTAAGAQLYFQYSGGTPATPHTTGSMKFAVCLEKIV